MIRYKETKNQAQANLSTDHSRCYNIPLFLLVVLNFFLETIWLIKRQGCMEQHANKTS